MLPLILKNRFFYFPFFIFLIAGCFILLTIGFSDFQLFINRCTTSDLRVIFNYITKLAEGFILLFLVIYFLFTNLKNLVIFAASWIATTVSVQFLKKIVFNHSLRPAGFFENHPAFQKFDEITYHYHHSFPSGHSADVFCCLTLLALTMKSKNLGFVLFAMASLVAFSRVYLSQHFLQDVLAGATLGVVISSIMYLKMIKISLPEKSVFDLKKK
jgi:membrane-associated phospholipid phosphatase